MSESRGLIFVIIAATSMFAMGAVPALAEEAAAVAAVSAAKEADVALNGASDTAVTVPEILATTTLAAIAKPKTGRTKTSSAFPKFTTPPPTRVAAAPHPHGGCFWCGRQMVLMLGVGY